MPLGQKRRGLGEQFFFLEAQGVRLEAQGLVDGKLVDRQTRVAFDISRFFGGRQGLGFDVDKAEQRRQARVQGRRLIPLRRVFGVRRVFEAQIPIDAAEIGVEVVAELQRLVEVLRRACDLAFVFLDTGDLGIEFFQSRLEGRWGRKEVFRIVEMVLGLLIGWDRLEGRGSRRDLREGRSGGRKSQGAEKREKSQSRVHCLPRLSWDSRASGLLTFVVTGNSPSPRRFPPKTL